MLPNKESSSYLFSLYYKSIGLEYYDKLLNKMEDWSIPFPARYAAASLGGIISYVIPASARLIERVVSGNCKGDLAVQYAGSLIIDSMSALGSQSITAAILLGAAATGAVNLDNVQSVGDPWILGSAAIAKSISNIGVHHLLNKLEPRFNA